LPDEHGFTGTSIRSIDAGKGRWKITPETGLKSTCISSSGCPSIIINQPSEDPKQEAPYNYNFLRQLELMLTFQKVMIAEAGASSLMAYGI